MVFWIDREKWSGASKKVLALARVMMDIGITEYIYSGIIKARGDTGAMYTSVLQLTALRLIQFLA